MFSKFLFCVIAIGSLLSLHTGFAINAFSHKDGEAIDIPFIAKWIHAQSTSFLRKNL
jgi:hypothetical protein